MDFNSCIESLKEALQFTPGMISPQIYSNTRKQIAELHWMKGNVNEAIYNLTECHAIGLRQICITESARRRKKNDYYKCVSFENEYAKKELLGMMERLKEMPNEWTIVQLTRRYDNMETMRGRECKTAPPLKDFYLTRLPCGSNLESECPLLVKREWPIDTEDDLLSVFWNVRKKLRELRKIFNNKTKLTVRKKVSKLVEEYCEIIRVMCLKEWLVLFLGTICDSTLKEQIRGKIDEVLDKEMPEVSRRERCMTYLLAEGIHVIDTDFLIEGLGQLYPYNSDLRDNLYNVIADIAQNTLDLVNVKRNPVILVLEDHFDHIPWESVGPFRSHPYSRMPSLHFVHAIFKVHRKHIKYGLREIDNSKNQYYCMLDRNKVRKCKIKMAEFAEKRFPDSNVLLGRGYNGSFLEDAIKKGNLFTYSGHGNGFQFFSGETVQHSKVRSCQLLMGCESVALEDEGGFEEMYGDFLKLLIAGSPCTIGMLWVVSTVDAELMTKIMLNMWLAGDTLDIKTLKKSCVEREPELLRAVAEVRKYVNSFYNGAALIARGIPTKAVKSDKK